MNHSSPANAVTVTIIAQGDNENSPAEAVHHGLEYARKAGFIEAWSDPVAPPPENAKALELADQIEQSTGLIRMVPGEGTVQLGIRKTALVIAALRSGIRAQQAAPPANANRERIAKIFAVIWHGDIGEWEGFLSKADAFLAFPSSSIRAQQTASPENERREFEAWFITIDSGRYADWLKRWDNGDGDYYYTEARTAWSAWSARALIRAQQMPDRDAIARAIYGVATDWLKRGGIGIPLASFDEISERDRNLHLAYADAVLALTSPESQS